MIGRPRLRLRLCIEETPSPFSPMIQPEPASSESWGRGASGSSKGEGCGAKSTIVGLVPVPPVGGSKSDPASLTPFPY